MISCNGLLRRVLIALSPALTCYAQGATVSMQLGLPEPGWIKVDHGAVLVFNRVQKAAGHDAIEAFDRDGQRVIGVDVRRQLPDSAEVSLYDVSFLPGGPLVAGAVVRKTDKSLQDVLLYFNREASLIKRVDLPLEQEINNLEIDSDGSVWTLTGYFGRKDDTRGPLIFHYDGEGRLIEGLLRRTDYPGGFEEGSMIGGVVGFGLTGEAIWFWEPIRHRLTVVSREGRVLRQESLRLPVSREGKLSNHPPEVSAIALLPSGQVAAGIGPNVLPGAYLSEGKRFARASSTPMPLLGVDGSEFIFLKRYEPGSSRMEIVRESLPPQRKSAGDR